MDTQFLETFVCVVEQGSMAEAARRLGITPAAVGQRMRALQVEIGVALVARAGRRVSPTSAGAALLEPARRILGEVANLQTAAQPDHPAGRLTLGCISTVLTGMMPATLLRLRQSAPQLELLLTPGGSPDLFDRVRSRELDAAVIVQPPFVMPKSMQWHTLRREPLVLLVHRALASRSVADLLLTQPFLRYNRPSWGGRLVDIYLRRTNVVPRDLVELDALEAIAVMVNQGLGVGIVPDWPKPWPHCPDIVTLPLRDTTVRRSIGMAYRRGTPRQRLVQALLEAIASE
ncbi:MAG: LysR family transcriptional regulator [Alphaproteobacteria bacterium]|nr:LysR family transcriptional regulator [Alphaproteobacteria bacterium]